MLRKLLATTALASVIATGAVAQDATTQPMQQPQAAPETAAPAQPADSQMAPADSAAQPMDSATQQTAAAGQYIQTLGADQHLATELTGSSVYASQAPDAEAIGEIQNFLLDQDGMIAAAVVDATIGDESRTIAIPFEQIGWAMDQNNEPRAVLTAGVEQLAQAPAFAGESADQAAVDPAMNATAPATTDMAAGTAADTAAPASSDMAAAPADPATPPASGDIAATAPADTAQGTEMAASDGAYPTTVGPNQYLSENLIGQDVYNGPSEDAEDIGEIKDLILASSGQTAGIVVGVGGFLGIGEKEVAVPFEQVSMSRGEDGELRASLPATKEQLEQAPGFDADDQQVAAGTEAPMTDATQTAAATGAAAGAAAGTVVQKTEDMAADAGQATENMAADAGQEIEGVVETPPVDAGDMAANTAPAADPAATAAATGAAAGMAASPDATTTASTGGDNRALTPVDDATQLSADDLLATTVYGPNDETIGDIGDIALNPEGQVDALIIDVGGFLGIGEKPVAVSMENLRFMRDANGSLFLYTQFTEDQLESAPEYNKDQYAANRDQMLLQQGAMPMTTTDAPAATGPATEPAPAPAAPAN